MAKDKKAKKGDLELTPDDAAAVKGGAARPNMKRIAKTITNKGPGVRRESR